MAEAEKASSPDVKADRAAIEAQLRALQEELEDLEHERNYVLKQTGVHIGAMRLKGMEEEYESDARRIKEKMAQLKTLLGER